MITVELEKSAYELLRKMSSSTSLDDSQCIIYLVAYFDSYKKLLGEINEQAHNTTAHRTSGATSAE